LLQLQKIDTIYSFFDVQVSTIGSIIMFLIRLVRRKEKYLILYRFDLINTIIPLQFTYAKSQGKDILDDLIGLLVCPAENNVIIQSFHQD
jgi:hypothetical protein